MQAGEAVGQKLFLHPSVNREVRRFAAAEIIEQFPRLGCQLLGHYGILNICSYLPNEPKFDPQYFAELERLEHRLTNVYPYYLLARMFQVVAQRS